MSAVTKKKKAPSFDEALRQFCAACRRLSRQTGAPFRVVITWDTPAEDYKGRPEKDKP